MRIVQPRPQRVVVVGAGLSGLAASMWLRAAGVEVTVLEAAVRVGGLAGELVIDGVRHDRGPTVLTMPALLQRPFDALGASMGAELEVTRLDPAYRAQFADGSVIEVGARLADTAASVENACGAVEADRFVRFADYCTGLHDIVFEPFMAANFDSPLDLLGAPLARLVRAGGFGSMQRKVDSMLRDARTRRLVSFQALYAGLAPRRARALYNVITYMDVIAGVYGVRGGLGAVPVAMARVARRAGVRIDCARPVTQVLLDGDRATGVIAGGQHEPADAVVLTCDPLTAARVLLGRQPSRRPVRRSPSCVVIHANVPSELIARQPHHAIQFGHEWERTFSELIDEHRPMSDPSLLVCSPSATDPTMRAGGSSPLYILAPCPNQQATSLMDAEVARIVEQALARLDERGLTLEPEYVVDVVGPLQWAERGMPAGTPFSLSHTFAQTGPFRPGNFPRRYRNVVLAGAGTVPGVGVPTTLVSGELAAQRVLGAAR